MSHIAGNPEIRVVRDGALVRGVTLVRDGHDDIDLLDLFSIMQIRRTVTVADLPKVEFEVMGRLVEVEAVPE